jgi:hypothetical protein
MIVIGIFLIALLKSVFFSYLGFGLLDQGQMLHNGQRIISGDLPYRDFFAVFPPMYNYIFVWIFQFFGQSILISRILLSVIFSFVPVLVYLIAKKVSSKDWALIPALLIIFMDVNIERIYFFAPILLAINLYISWFDKQDKKLLFYTGLLLGIASIFRFDISGVFGVAMIISAAIFLKTVDKAWLKKWFFVCFALGLGYLVPVIFMFGWLVSKGLLTSFIQSTVIDPILITKLHHLSFPSLISIFPISISGVWLSQLYLVIYANLLVVLYIYSSIMLLRLWKSFWRKEPWFGFFLISGLLSLPYVMGRTEAGHLLKGGMPFLFLGIYFIKRISSGKNKLLKFMSLVFIASFFIANIALSFWWINFNDKDINVNGNRLKINSSYLTSSTSPSANTLERSVKFLRAHSSGNEKVLVLPYMAGLYFLADRQSPTRFDNILNGYMISDKEQEDFIKQIQMANVKVVIYDPKHGPKMRTPLLKDYNPLIHSFIMYNFITYEETPEGWLFMLRKN